MNFGGLYLLHKKYVFNKKNVEKLLKLVYFVCIKSHFNPKKALFVKLRQSTHFENSTLK